MDAVGGGDERLERVDHAVFTDHVILSSPGLQDQRSNGSTARSQGLHDPRTDGLPGVLVADDEVRHLWAVGLQERAQGLQRRGPQLDPLGSVKVAALSRLGGQALESLVCAQHDSGRGR